MGERRELAAAQRQKGKTMITIDHERFGERSEFENLTEAVECLRACGDEFAAVTLTIHGSGVYDERRDLVGTVGLTDDDRD